MAAPASTEEFLDLVRKSGVTDERRFADYVAKARAAGTLASEAAPMAGALVRDGLLTQFQAEQILQGKWRRFSIGKYKVLERLGAGGMGQVFLCEHKLMRRRVAVKVLPTAQAADEASLKRFYREARAVAALDHPNIVHAYDIDQDEQLHFLVMEYVDGVNLQDLVKKTGPLDILRACHYIRQSAEGLEHAHRAGLVHRDIKPGNILVDRTGTVKILDMGLARFFSDEDDILTKKFDENVLGTADYLAPEQALDSHSVDIRADVYSLGATFYYLLTGRTVFGDGTIAQKLLWHQTRVPKPVSEYRPAVPAEITAIITKMMDKDPNNRFQSPGEFAEALAPYTATPIGPPPEAEMPTLSPAALGVIPTEADADTSVSLKSDNSPSPKALKTMISVTAKPSSGVGSRPSSSLDTAAAGTSSNTPVSPRPRQRPQSGPRDEAAEFSLVDAAPSKPITPKPAPNLPKPRKPLTSARPDDGNPWDTISSAGATPADSTAAQKPIAKPVAAKKSATPSAPGFAAELLTPKNKKIALYAGGGVLALLIIIFAAAAMMGSGGGTRSGRRPFEVTANPVKGQRQFRTIADALKSKDLQRGDVIQINDERHEEQLQVAAKLAQRYPADLTIQAAPGKNVVWYNSVKSRLDAPVIYVVGLGAANSLRIQGPNLTIDGALDADAKLDTLVDISGDAPGLTFDKVKFKGFKKSAISLAGAQGTAERPIRFIDCHFEGGDDRDADAAIAFQPSSRPSDFIEFTALHPLRTRATFEFGEKGKSVGDNVKGAD
jgi:serine/threonine protein kinase